MTHSPMLPFNAYEDLLRNYGEMWDFKFRGNTLEIITPHSTISNKFASVFITMRGQELIVSDGGYLHAADYVDNEQLGRNKCYINTLEVLEKFYSIKRTFGANQRIVSFTKTTDYLSASSLIHDMASFIVSVANAQVVALDSEDREASTTRLFARQAGDFITKSFPARELNFNQPLRPDDRINFSVGIWRNSKVNLVQYVTGSTDNYFVNSLTKATVNFLAVGGSSLESIVEEKISLIDTTAKGFNNRNGSYTTLLSKESNVIYWDDRKDLLDLIEAN